MARRNGARQNGPRGAMRARIAAAAARIMAEEGIDDFALAKRKAARRVGAPASEALPANEEIEAELREYLALYQADEHPERVAGLRRLALWQAPGRAAAVGDRFRVSAGCDKRADTCRQKFSNFLNFRGFPHIPGDDWVTAYPRDGAVHDGGSQQ